MFKDIYKRANDNIPTGAAYTRVMNRLDAPKKSRAFGYTLARTAALTACLIFTFSAISIYENRAKAPMDIVISSSEPTPAPTQVQVEENTQKPATQKPKTSAKPRTVEPQVQAEVEPVVVEAKVKNEIKINDLNILAQNAASAYSREIIGAVKEVSLDEYREYLGRDIESAVVLPEGFSNTTEQTAYLNVDENDSYISDEWSFVFQSDNASCEIVTTKKLDTVQKYIDNEIYEKSSVCDKDAVIFADADLIRAYAVSDGIGYTITTVGVEMSDSEELLKSILE